MMPATQWEMEKICTFEEEGVPKLLDCDLGSLNASLTQSHFYIIHGGAALATINFSFESEVNLRKLVLHHFCR